MGSTALYSSTSRKPSWSRLPNTHLQGDNYHSQVYQQPSQDSMQKRAPTLQFRSQLTNQEESDISQWPLSQLQNLKDASHLSVGNSSQPPSKSSCNFSDKHDSYSRKLGNSKSLEPSVNTSQSSSLPSLYESGSSSSEFGNNLHNQNKNSCRISKTSKCYTCQKDVQDIHFMQHLFFGPVRCKQCGAVFIDCEVFSTLFLTRIGETSFCNHILEFCSDPFDYICAHLSGELNPAIGGLLVPPNVLKDLSDYIEDLNSLGEKDPWRYAIAKCRNYLPSTFTEHFKATKTSVLHEGAKSKTPREVFENGQVLEERSIGERSLVNENTESLVSASPPLAKHSRRHTGNDSNVWDTQKMVDRVPETQNSVPDNTEKAVYPSNSLAVSSEDRSYKRKAINSARDSTGKELESEETSTEIIALPEDSNYLILRKSIEECPMCYTDLCPSRFTVNVQTFLMTTACVECNLPIYIVPDDSSSNLFIITSDSDEAATSKPKSFSKKKQKRKLKTKSCRFFAQ